MTQGGGKEPLWPPALPIVGNSQRKRVNSPAAPASPKTRPDCVCCNRDLELKGGAVSPLHHLDSCPGLSNSSHRVLELECFSCQVWADAGAGEEVEVCLVLVSAGSLGRTLWFLGGHLLRALLGVLSRI